MTRSERRENNKWPSFSSKSTSIHTSPSSSDQESAQSNLTKSVLDYKAQKAKLRKVTILVLRPVKMHYIVTIDHHTYRLANRFLR